MDEKNHIIDDIQDVSDIDTKHSVSRPPRPPGPALGPYFQFITTELDKMLWIGSILLFRHVDYQVPTIQFVSVAKVEFAWEVLYENLFNMRAYRINLFIQIRQGDMDDQVEWKIDWGDYSTNGHIFIPQHNQKWRGAFFSCNGFDATVSKQDSLEFTYNTVWNHLLSIHEDNPFHLLVWGGDQNYNDFVLDDIEFLVNWAKMNWDEKWKVDFDIASRRQVEEYYFNNYIEHWENRPEMKRALGCIPSLMMWDDHDIYDGAGSYPPLLHDSPIMLGLFDMAQKMRLLFQHHTSPAQARKHHLFGHKGYNFLARCGPHLAILGTDGRTERDDQTVIHDDSWNMIFNRIEEDLDDTIHHILVISAIPLIFARFKLAESILETAKKLSMKWRRIPFSEHVNSVFGLPEIYDDLVDEWTHESHIDERNDILQRFQDVARRKHMRVTFFSGDVHCCGVGRFQSRNTKTSSKPFNDSKLMYQIISSAIVNRPPPKIVIRAAHLFGRRWYPIQDTKEELIDFFEKSPVNGSPLFLKKLLPNRNWCFFTETSAQNLRFQNDVAQGLFERLFWYLFDFLVFCLGLVRIFGWFRFDHRKYRRTYEFSPSGTSEQLNDVEKRNLQVRFWLENDHRKKERQGFTNYDLFIPYLK